VLGSSSVSTSTVSMATAISVIRLFSIKTNMRSKENGGVHGSETNHVKKSSGRPCLGSRAAAGAPGDGVSEQQARRRVQNGGCQRMVCVKNGWWLACVEHRCLDQCLVGGGVHGQRALGSGRLSGGYR
jgi:hypothetical protein